MSHLIRLFNFKGNSQNYALVKPEHVYRQVDNSDGYQSSEDAVESIVITERKGRVLSHIERLLWLSVVALLSVTLVVRLAAERSQRDCLRNMSSYELGFASDLGISTEHIALKPVQFTSGIERDEHGELFLNLSGVRKMYVGEPSPIIDANWDELEGAVELVLTRGETSTKDGQYIQTMEEPGSDSMYRVSVDVIHSLHCVNQLRKAVYFDHYFKGKPTAWYLTHMDHCVDHLRQAIECHADLTPLAYEFDEHKKLGSPIWTNPHMCRDFERILAWDKTRVGPVIL